MAPSLLIQQQRRTADAIGRAEAWPRGRPFYPATPRFRTRPRGGAREFRTRHEFRSRQPFRNRVQYSNDDRIALLEIELAVQARPGDDGGAQSALQSRPKPPDQEGTPLPQC